ncbi:MULTISPECIES: hypothetical protein [Legionella]|uniref:Uncharacterized protein n=1 Tax=Legionella resiliens TaxID=2905958 RepID=A0ABS8X355_9GAMM|nr:MULTISPECIES: hypothetical protein [unclassified Legionella]MCE0723041.1 hypothetical protein [Legionella sp. 9fVS26]MCE3532194.1 hypothetical protein [Legionella sp. 8cVS16]QLZ68321.1 hypothetical protein FOLKNPGA_01099 [Legionella sp. PC1000]
MISKDDRLKKSLENFESQGAKDTSGGHTAGIHKKKAKETRPNSQRNKKSWFVKEAYSPDEPLELEVISGEVYRFWIGNTQPKTRLVTDKLDKRYVASEGVPGFKTFKSIMEQGGKPTDYKTLARILVSALVLAETDLKADNIGVNSGGTSVKIDHDSSLWPIVRRIMSMQNDLNQVNFSFEDLDDILAPKTFKPTIWAGGLKKEIKDELRKNEEFKKEVYLQILRILVYPPEVLTKIQEVNAPSDLQLKEEIDNFLQERISLLRTEALKSKGFREFITNLNIDDCESEFKSELKEFFSENRAYAEGIDISHSMLKAIHKIKDQAQLSEARAGELDKITLLKEKLNLDRHNHEHLAYWQEKTKAGGGTLVEYNGTYYKVPSKIAQMMKMDADSFSSYIDFKDEIDKIRKSDESAKNTNSLYSFFGEVKNKITRDKVTQALYEIDDIEEADLNDLDPSFKMK